MVAIVAKDNAVLPVLESYAVAFVYVRFPYASSASNAVGMQARMARVFAEEQDALVYGRSHGRRFLPSRPLESGQYLQPKATH